MANNNPKDFKKAKELHERLKQYSKRTGIPVADLIRKALALYAIPNEKPSEAKTTPSEEEKPSSTTSE